MDGRFRPEMDSRSSIGKRAAMNGRFYPDRTSA
jgi:hypothetical protein